MKLVILYVTTELRQCNLADVGVVVFILVDGQ